jgi:hypothetical protein
LCRPSRSPADALDETRRERRLGLDVDELVLERRGAAVDDEDDGHALLLLVLRLDRGDGDRVDDVFDQRAARQVVDGLVESLQHRSHGDRARGALHRLVGVVAGVEVGEDEHGRPAGDRRVGHLRLGDGGVGRRVVLDRAFDEQLGARSRTNAVASRTLSTSSPDPDSPVEYDSIATRGSMPN